MYLARWIRSKGREQIVFTQLRRAPIALRLRSDEHYLMRFEPSTTPRSAIYGSDQVHPNGRLHIILPIPLQHKPPYSNASAATHVCMRCKKIGGNA